MDKIEEQIIEDGELTSESDNEIESITCFGRNNGNCDTCEVSNIPILDKKIIFDNENSFIKTDFQNLLIDFENHVKMKKSDLNESKPKNKSQKSKKKKKVYSPELAKSPLMEEDDEMIFVRGASPPLSSFDESVYITKEISSNNLDLEHESSYNKYCKVRKVRKTGEISKRRNTKSRWETIDRNYNDLNENSNSSSSSGMFTQQLKICKFYLHGKCGKTEKTCTFLHSQFPCKYYYLGIKCPDGNDCKLNHGGILSDEMKEALLLHIQIAPREILGNFKISAEHAKKLLNDRHTELTNNNIEMRSKNDENIPKSIISLDSEQPKSLIKSDNFAIPDFFKIENFNDILTEEQMNSLKKIGVSFSYQLLTLSMIKLNDCGINVMEIVKIQERIKENDKIKSSIISNDSDPKEDIDMRHISLAIQNPPSINTKDISIKPIVRYNDSFFNENGLEEIDEEESNLVIDEEAANISEGELELLKRDLQNKINQTQNEMHLYYNQINLVETNNDDIIQNNTDNVENVAKSNIERPESSDGECIIDLSMKQFVPSESNKIQYEKLMPFKPLLVENISKDKESKNNNNNEDNKDLKHIETNDYAEDLRKISININTIDDIKIINSGDFDMRLPFNPVLKDYKPATECDGSFATHSLIPWKLAEILIAAKEPIPIEMIEKLKQSNDPRFRKQSKHQEQYSFDGIVHNIMQDPIISPNINTTTVSDNENNNIISSYSDFTDPRKNQSKSSTYENLSNQPSVMQLLQHYLHRSIWYNEQNSKTKMEINELVAELANHLKKFKQQNLPNKKFILCELKNFNKIQNILFHLKIFIDPNGSILQERIPDLNYFDNTGIVTNNFIGGFDPFWNGMHSVQPQLPVISNLVPIGSFQAPAPLHYGKPGLLGMHPNDVTGLEFNNQLRASTAAIHNNNMHFGNNIFYGNQNFALRFGGNCKPLFPPEPEVQNQSFRMIQRVGNQRTNDRNANRNKNNFRSRNNNINGSNGFANRYNSINSNKNKYNNNSNNYHNSDDSLDNNSTDNINKKKFTKCDDIEENWDENSNSDENKMEKINLQRSLNNNIIDEENWDDEEKDNQPNQPNAFANNYNTTFNCDQEIVKQNKNFVKDEEENWDSDNEEVPINSLNSDKKLTDECDYDINKSSMNSTTQNATAAVSHLNNNIEGQDNNKNNNNESYWEVVPEKKLKLDFGCDSNENKSVPNNYDLKSLTVPEKIFQDSKVEESYYFDTTRAKIEESKEFSKCVNEDSEEDWD